MTRKQAIEAAESCAGQIAKGDEGIILAQRAVAYALLALALKDDD